MPRQQQVSVENNFTGGLKTEFTGLTFPENACTETFNCVFDRRGNVSRRLGINYEANSTSTTLDRDGVALSSFFWENADGGGNVNLFVIQVGNTLRFYNASLATTLSPLSQNMLGSIINLATFLPSGGSLSDVFECQYSSANGKLFVFNPRCDPFYVTFVSPSTITGTRILVKIRDTEGVDDGFADDFRPPTLGGAHQYNLTNQGWGKNWFTTSPVTISLPASGTQTFTNVTAGLNIQVGDRVRAVVQLGGYASGTGEAVRYLIGTVSSYVGTNLMVDVVSSSGGGNFTNWDITPEPPLLRVWASSTGNYPSNSDVWWHHLTSRTTSSTAAGVTTANEWERFDPARTLSERPAPLGRAPRGFFVLEAWNQDRTAVSNIALSLISTTVRPKTGAWFAGRVWYAGVQDPTFTEKIYFSQIIERPEQFGKCYQVNDPTNKNFFDLLPTDGGVIVIPGAGTIHKLFPVQNGILVFASAGIWFITGSEGIGFTANDYTIVKLSAIPTISHTSFVSVRGYPMFWNEDGIYAVQPNEQGTLNVKSLTDDSIAAFYAEIPFLRKKLARGDYNPIDGIVQWAYKPSTGDGDQYHFENILNFNVHTGAFYPWTVSAGGGISICVHDVKYIYRDEGSMFKYWVSQGNGAGAHNHSFAEESDVSFLDFNSGYESFFVTGYKIHGQAQRKFQTNCIYIYSDNLQDTMYNIKAYRNYGGEDSESGSSTEQVSIAMDEFRHAFKKHKLRGTGLVMQFKVFSVEGEPFHIIGWSVYETSNARP